MLKFLGLGGTTGKADQGDTDTVRRIVAELDRLEPDRPATSRPSCTSSAGRDRHREISDAETQAMERIVTDRGALPEAQSVMVVQIAKRQNRLFGGTEDFLVAREFGRMASYEQKLALLECLFIVSAIRPTITLARGPGSRQGGARIEGSSTRTSSRAARAQGVPRRARTPAAD